MKYFTLGLMVLFCCSVQAAEMPNTSQKQDANDHKSDRQFYLPSGSGAIPITITDDSEKSTAPVNDKIAESIKAKWGVGDFMVHITSAGYMLDVRYRVYDKKKAKPLFDRKLRPFAIEEATGIKYGVPASPKVGFLRQAPQQLKANKQYFLMIANPGRRIKTGDRLTLVIGDFRVEHLTVE